MPLLKSQTSRPLSYELLKLATSFYFIVALILSAIQVVIEYQRTKTNISTEIKDYEDSFKEPLVNSLWSFDDKQTLFILQGALKSPNISGVQIKLDDNKLFNVGDISESSSNFIHSKRKLFYKEPSNYLGDLIIYSNNSFVANKIKSVVVISIANTLVGIAFLWGMLIFLVNRKVKQPINQLANELSMVSARNPKPIEGSFTDGTQEFIMIKNSFNSLIGQIQNYKNILEALVENTTEELREKDKESKDLINKLDVARNRMIEKEKLASLGLLTAGISHELKNPLNLSLNSAKILKSKNFTGSYMKLIDIIIESNVRMERIIKNTLSQSKGHNKLEVINLKQFLKHNIELAQKSYVDNKNINIQLDIKDDLKLNVEKDSFIRLFVNLYENSRYALLTKLKDHDFQPEIQVKAIKSMLGVLITFKDNGVGIPKKLLNKITDPFFSTKSEKENSGLGLYLVLDIVNNLNGYISFDAQEGEYTLITIEIPFEEQDDDS